MLRPMIRQVAPQFFTTDLRATLAYYSDKLGFECLGTWNDPPVYAIVARDGKVSPRNVKIGGSQNGQWVVLEGLQPGEQVMVDGFQKLQPGAPVKPVPWSAAAASAASAPAAAAASAPASAASQAKKG